MPILVSIKPFFTEKIYSGSKTVELRKKIGKKFLLGETIFIYSSSPTQAITGSAIISKVEKIPSGYIDKNLLQKASVDKEFVKEYFKNCEFGYAIHLKEVVNFTNPIKLRELKKYSFTPPQSFLYPTGDLLEILEHSK